MNCEQIRNLLDEYVDAELSHAQRAAVDDHLAGCEACRAEVRALTEAAALVRSLPRVPAPEGLAEGVQAAVERSSSRRARAAVLRWAGVGGWLAAAALLVVIIRYAPWEGTVDTGFAPPREVAKTRPAEPQPGPADRARGGVREEKASAEARVFRAKDKEAELARRNLAEAEGAACLRKDAASPPSPAAGVSGAPGALAMDEHADHKSEADAMRTALAAKATSPARTGGYAAAFSAKADAVADALANAGHELTYRCKDVRTGLEELRKIIAAIPGAMLIETKGLNATSETVLVTLPGAQLAALTAKVSPPPAEPKAVQARESTDGASPALPHSANAMNLGGAGGGGAQTVTVKITLKPASTK